MDKALGHQEINSSLVDEAIAAVLRQPMPMDVMQRVLDRAAAWEAQPDVRRSSSSWSNKWFRDVAAIAAGVLLLLAGIWSWNRESIAPDGAKSVTTARVAEAPVATTELPAKEPPVMAFRMTLPMVRAYVASRAPILVSYGGEKPLRWGTKVLHAEVNRGLASGMVRLHIWDFSKSEDSRVLVAKGKPGPLHFGAVSPDGSFLLGTDGVTIDLRTGETTAHAGFDMIAEQRIHQMQFSPSGRYVLARLVHTKMVREPSPANKPLFSNHHTWTLRVIDLKEGRIVKEYALDPLQESVALADESSLICMTKEGTLCRQNFLTGEVMQRFEPLLDPSGVAEMNASSDGKRIAISYLGEVIVWNVDSAHPLFRQKLHEENMPKEAGTRVKGLLFSANGKLLTAETGFQLFMLDAASGKRIAERKHSELVWFDFRQWSTEEAKVALITPPLMTDTTQDRFPPRSTADLLPQVYEWDWKANRIEPKVFAKTNKP